MKKSIVSLFAILAAMVLTSSLAAAGEMMKSESAMEKQAEQMQAGDIPSASKLMGMKVVSRDGEELGKIKDIMIDRRTDKISFVTLDKTSVLGKNAERKLGLGEKDVAVPLAVLNFAPETNEATLLVDPDKLNNVPIQSRMTEAEFEQKLQDHYGISPAWQEQRMQKESSGMMEGKKRPMEGQEKSKY